MNEAHLAPHWRYRLLALLSAIFALLFAARLLMNEAATGGILARTVADPGSLFFFVVMIGLTLWYLRTLLSHIALTPDGVALVLAGRTVHAVENRQFLDVIEAGRLLQSVTLLYHPLQADGLIDLDAVRSLDFPAVQQQEQFVSHLQNRIPR